MSFSDFLDKPKIGPLLGYQMRDGSPVRVSLLWRRVESKAARWAVVIAIDLIVIFACWVLIMVLVAVLSHVLATIALLVVIGVLVMLFFAARR